MPYEEYCAKKTKNIEAHLSNEALSPQQQKELRAFLDEYAKNRGVKIPSCESYIRTLSFFGQYLRDKGKTSYRQATKEDIKQYFEAPYPLPGSKTNAVRIAKVKSQSVMGWIKISLKVFYRWLLKGGISRRDPYPKIVDWIIVPYQKPSKINRDKLPTAEEVKQILDFGCRNQRDRAFISLADESGCREGELTNMCVKDVRLDGEAPYIDVRHSKTLPRKVYIFSSIHELKNWLVVHPEKNNPDARLFAALKGEKRGIDEASAYSIVTRAAKRAGIKKKIWVHLFRHAACTRATSGIGMPTQLANLKFGFSENSRVILRYSHAVPEDVRNFELRARGVANVEDAKPIPVDKICSRCKEKNSYLAHFCNRCATPMDEIAVISEAKQLNDANKIGVAILLERIERLEKKLTQH